jgi:hypothetical protein
LSRKHFDDYDEKTTARCERVLLTLLGDLGPWRERIYLAGGLAPRYLIGGGLEGAAAHVGTSDVDLIIGLALGDETPETYRTLQNNLKSSKFKQGRPSFRWYRDVDGVNIVVEFLCETERVEPGAIFRLTGEAVGSNLGPFNVRGAQLAARDYIELGIEGERLDNGGLSKVTLRVANVLPYVVLKINAFQDRHENKDAYDLVFTLLNFGDDPSDAGRSAAKSPVAHFDQVSVAMTLMAERFKSPAHDGPAAYANFLAVTGDDEELARFRQDAFAVVRQFLEAFFGKLYPTDYKPAVDVNTHLMRRSGAWSVSR